VAPCSATGSKDASGYPIVRGRCRRSSHIAYSYGDVVDRGDATAGELRELLAEAAAG